MRNMTQTRKLLKGLGIALIALPEPFTTPVGVALLCAAYALPGKPRVDSYNRLQEFCKLYLSLYQARSCDYNMGGQPRMPEKIARHTLRHDWSGQPIMPEKIVHHTIRYDWPGHPIIPEPVIPEKIVHHTLKRKLTPLQTP